MVRTVGAEVQQPDRAAAAGLSRIDIKHVGLEMARLRMVGGVHGYGLRVVVDGNIDIQPGSLLDAAGCAAATGEQIANELAAQV